MQTVSALGEGCSLLKANLSRITILDILQSPFVLDAHGSLVRNVGHGYYLHTGDKEIEAYKSVRTYPRSLKSPNIPLLKH